jgi:tetratricopeptide (TPR) repeat protein
VWKLSSGRPYLAVGYLWFLGTLVPVIGIVQIGAQSMADRYAYIPLIGIFVAVVWGVYASAQSRGVNGRWLTSIASLILLALALLTWRQVSYWKNSISLWSHALDVTIDNFVAEEDLAVGLANQGSDDEALPHFIIARNIRPNDPIANLNIGINLERHGRHQEAIRQFQSLIRINDDPDHLDHLFDAHRRLGVIYTELGDRPKARAELLQAFQVRPEDPEVLADLSRVETDEVVDKLSKAVSARPTAQGYFQLGHALEQDHKVQDAQTAYENALHLDPKLADARQALTNLKSSPN